MSDLKIEQIQTPILEDLETFNRIITKQLKSDFPFINKLNEYIIHSGGKRMRPTIILLLARALGYEGQAHLTLATTIEFIHTATLLHDDVIDNTDFRRNKKTVKQLWGNSASILTGDFLYSRAFQIILALNSTEIIKLLTQTTNTLVEGEMMQLVNCGNYNTDEKTYFETIHRKTAVLFETGAHISALISSSDEKTIQAIQQFGLNLGIGFQLIDDILDYSDKNNSGKSIGNDLIEGKATLPFIYALEHSSATNCKKLKNALANHNNDDLQIAIEIVRLSGGLDYTHKQARHYIEQSLQAFEVIPDSTYKSALYALTQFFLQRNY